MNLLSSRWCVNRRCKAGRQIVVSLAGRNWGLVADTAESQQPNLRTALRVHLANVSPRTTMLFRVFRILGCREKPRPFRPKPKNLPTPRLSTTGCDDRAIHRKPRLWWILLQLAGMSMLGETAGVPRKKLARIGPVVRRTFT